MPAGLCVEWVMTHERVYAWSYPHTHERMAQECGMVRHHMSGEARALRGPCMHACMHMLPNAFYPYACEWWLPATLNLAHMTGGSNLIV
eukprot:349620-Chlamydomonas_euryale.AAC.4